MKETIYFLGIFYSTEVNLMDKFVLMHYLSFNLSGGTRSSFG